MNKTKNIFAHTDCISEEMLMKYISGTLSPAEKHEVEKHLIDCPMCSDAVEGLQIMTSPQPSPKERGLTSQKAIDELNIRIRERAEKKEGKIIFLQQYRTQLAVAASIIVVIGLVWFFRSNRQELDSASSEKIFADKFEAPPSERAEESKAESIQRNAENNSQPAATEDKQANKRIAPVGVAANKTNAKPRRQTAMPEDRKVSEIQNELTLQDDQAAKEEAVAPLASSGASLANAAAPVANKALAFGVQEKNKATNTPAPAEEKAAAPAQTGEGDMLAFESANKKKQNAVKKEAAPQKAAQGYYETQAVPAAAAKAQTAIMEAEAVALDSVYANAGAAFQDDAMAKYDKQDYAGAVTAFEQALKQNPNDEKALFYSGVSYLSLGQADKAVTGFNKVLQNKNSRYYDDAQWYLSLSYLKKKDAPNARKNLMEIQNNPKSKYQKQAGETLKEMNK
ncbi:MAG: tetratricopeptide repeat protein [Bacteroidetes bacterium]|nr:tetratricopeptide repeat protein [Bacteroidota bacterium]